MQETAFIMHFAGAKQSMTPIATAASHPLHMANMLKQDWALCSGRVEFL